MKCVSTARAQKSHSLNHFINITQSEHKKQTHDESLGDPQTLTCIINYTSVSEDDLHITEIWLTSNVSWLFNIN